MSNNKTSITLILSMIISLLLITIGLSFAYFTANITNTEDSTTIYASGGVMNINYDGGENINAPNIFPDSNPFITKEFTVTGKNSNPNEDMHYHLLLVLDENTFRSSALTYTLESNNEDDNGYVVPEIITQTGIKTGEREIFLGNGMFTPTNNNGKTHSYTLKLYFPKIEHFEHGVDQGKIFKAHIETREGEIYPGYNEEKGVNHPVLFTGMTPVKWDENNDEINTTEDDPDWYDYDEKRWANAKSKDGSYWVWIPRYAYKIETCYHMSGEECENLTGKQAGDINVKFLKSTTNLTEDNTIIETTGYEAHVKDTSMHHFLHPVFHFYGEELGFWVAKFEPSVASQGDDCYLIPNITNCDNNNIVIKIIPNAHPWRYVSILTSYQSSLNLYQKADIYGWNFHELDSHMMTNYEWGAVAYLSKSKYGAHNNEVWNNSYTEYLTGCSGTSVNSSYISTCIEYNTLDGVKASSTFNIYGIYDMSGGANERVMANYNNYDGNGLINKKILESIYPKHLTRYFTQLDALYDGVGFLYNKEIYGDAVYETSNDAAKRSTGLSEGNAFGSWFYADTSLPSIIGSWFARSSHLSSSLHAGLFAFKTTGSEASEYSTFRPVLTPL